MFNQVNRDHTSILYRVNIPTYIFSADLISSLHFCKLFFPSLQNAFLLRYKLRVEEEKRKKSFQPKSLQFAAKRVYRFSATIELSRLHTCLLSLTKNPSLLG